MIVVIIENIGILTPIDAQIGMHFVKAICPHRKQLIWSESPLFS
jgi:hypothetical protein